MSHTHCQCTHTHAPHRFDVVGSFLRPEALKEARLKFEKGELSAAQLKEVEDREIIALTQKQAEVGLKSLTDGEFRRAYWHLDFFWGLNGVAHTQAKVGYQFHDETTKADSASLTGTLSGTGHPFVEDFKFVKAIADEKGLLARQTIPAPSQFYFELIRDEEHIANTFSIYSSKEALFNDIVSAYKDVANELYEAGCRSLQIDDCTWGVLVDTDLMGLISAESGKTTEAFVDELAVDFLELNNAFLLGLPEDLVVTTHICRGNYHSTWASKGGYGAVADKLFGEENVSAYYLEYDNDRSGDFKPLEKVRDGQKVVLGLVTSKFADLEDKNLLISRIKEASQYVPLENLCLSPQCGFASTEEGNKLTEAEQWAKLNLIKDVVAEVWGE